MCAYGLRGRKGGLICKPTGWLSNNSALLASVTHKCNGLHEHEECMGGNAKLAAVYTKQLAKSLVDAFTSEMQDLGDERFILATSASSSATSFPTSSSSRRPMTPSRAPLTPMPGTPMPGTPAWPVPFTPGPGPMLEDDHVSLQKDPDSWRPLLKEAAERLEGKVAVAAEIKPSALPGTGESFGSLAHLLRPDLPDTKDTTTSDSKDAERARHHASRRSTPLPRQHHRG